MSAKDVSITTPVAGSAAGPEAHSAEPTGEGVHSRPITRGDAQAIARLETLTYPAELRAGRAQLRADIGDAEWEDSNLSFGLFDGRELVGVILVYYETDCRGVFGYFGIDTPSDVTAEECLYVADFIVARLYSRYALRFAHEWRASLSASYRALPVYGFSTAAMAEQWSRRRRAIRRGGIRYSGKRRFALREPPHEVFLVRFTASGSDDGPLRYAPHGLHVETVGTLGGWDALRADWDRLLRSTPDWTAFQCFDLQKIWWRHHSQNGWPALIVVYEGGRVRAIAPFWIRATSYLGRVRRLLKFIGEHTEVDRPTILREGEDRVAVEAVFQHLFHQDRVWDSMLLYEQPRGGLVLSVATRIAAASGVLMSTVPGPTSPWTDVRRPWRDFIAGKPASFRKNLRRKREKLAALGEVKFVTYDTWPEVIEGFDQYRQVEQRSWKPERGLGVARTQKDLDYHTALLFEFGPRRRLHFRVLTVGSKPIAATFGLLDSGHFLSLHIAHDRDYSKFSPGVLLTAYEIEEAHNRADYEEYDFLGGFLENKTDWAENARETQHLYVYRRNALFMAHFGWHFVLVPVAKKVLDRLGWRQPLVKAKAYVLTRLGRVNQDD
ncbi:MAG: GNAT family N-acetyltransferase [Gammaproteobacteria bacterium]